MSIPDHVNPTEYVSERQKQGLPTLPNHADEQLPEPVNLRELLEGEPPEETPQDGDYQGFVAVRPE